ncbi:CREB-binding protein-like [Sycon ciliatum]|uniref:CREB-binding protein-like n=1 Tax=Sycon ciliatum TaxID=27933 RepID=UPI0031F70204
MSSSISLEKMIQIREHLLLIVHAKTCQLLETAGNRPICGIPNCKMMKDVLTHLRVCQAGLACEVAHCSSSRPLLKHWLICGYPDCNVCSAMRPLYRLYHQKARNSTQGGTMNGANPATAAALSMIKVEPSTEMLPPPGNVVGAGSGAASSGATPSTNLGLQDFSDMYKSLPDCGMLPSGGNHIGSAPRGSGIHGGNPGLLPNAALPVGQVGAGNMQQPISHPMANQGSTHQMDSCWQVSPPVANQPWHQYSSVARRQDTIRIVSQMFAMPNLDHASYPIGQIFKDMECTYFSYATCEEEYMMMFPAMFDAYLLVECMKLHHHQQQQQQQREQQQQQQQDREQR